MRSTHRGVVAALVAAVMFGFVSVTSSTAAGAITALIMGGTSQPHPENVRGYIDGVSRLYIDAGSSCKVGNCELVPVYIPNEASPILTDGMVFGDSVDVGVGLLDDAVRAALARSGEHVVVFGNSQSATVATEVKRTLSVDPGIDPSRLEFVLIANPNRPNGGFMQRFFPGIVPIFEYTPKGTTLDHTGIPTTDIAFQYDIGADFPRYPLNLFAVLNSFIGIGIHGTYTGTLAGYNETDLLAQIDNPKNRTVVGDTTYVSIPAKRLPLAEALRRVGYTMGTSAVMLPLADLLEPALQVIVELGYERDIPAGQQRSFGLLPELRPAEIAADLGKAIGQGIHNMVVNLIARQRAAAQHPSEEPIGAGALAPGDTVMKEVAEPEGTSLEAEATPKPLAGDSGQGADADISGGTVISPDKTTAGRSRGGNLGQSDAPLADDVTVMDQDEPNQNEPTDDLADDISDAAPDESTPSSDTHGTTLRDNESDDSTTGRDTQNEGSATDTAESSEGGDSAPAGE